MRTLNQDDVENYQDDAHDILMDKDHCDTATKGRCHMCGAFLTEVDLPGDFVRAFYCKDCLDIYGLFNI